MDLNITKSKIDELRQCIKKYKPYEEDDPILEMFDGKCDVYRMKATTAKRILEHFGINPYDDNDYGNIND